MSTEKPTPEPTPPCDPAAELALLAALLIEPEMLLGIDPPLAKGDFSLARNGELYAVLCELGDRARCDTVTVGERVRARGLDWTAAELVKLYTDTPTGAHAPYYADIVRAKAVLRRLFYAGPKIIQLALAPAREGQSVGEQAEEAGQKAAAVVATALGQESDAAMLAWSASLAKYFELLDLRAKEQQDPKPVLTFPWKALQGFIPRLRPGTVAIVAASSSIGKTTFCECCAERWAKDGFNVAFFHFELSHDIMLDRRMCRQARLALADLEKGKDEIIKAVSETSAQMQEWPGSITYIHCPGWTMQRVANKARLLASRGQVDAVVVDYLQKAKLQEWARGQTVAQIRGGDVEALKVLAEELGLVVLLASQLNREALTATYKTRHQIRDTGEADEKGNVVCTLDREILLENWLDPTSGAIVALKGELAPTVRVRVDKNTLGRTGEAKLVLDGPHFDLKDEAR